MKSINIKSVLALVLTPFVLCTLALSGCQKNFLEEQGVNDGIIKYAVALGSHAAVKGVQVNTTGSESDLSDFESIVGTFETKAFDGSTETLSQTVVYDGSAWVGTPVAYWPQATRLTFYAYANLPTAGSSISTVSAGQTLTHSVPAMASDQKDILLGYYKGNGGNTGTAKIHFDHPLTAIVFKDAGLLDGKVVKSITLTEIASSGTVTMGPDGVIGTWSISNYNGEASQSKTGGLDIADDVIGEPFLIIPQNAETHPIKVNVEMTDGTELESVIKSGVLEARMTNFFTISVSAVHWLGIGYISPWGSESSL